MFEPMAWILTLENAVVHESPACWILAAEAATADLKLWAGIFQHNAQRSDSSTILVFAGSGTMAACAYRTACGSAVLAGRG